MKRFGLKMITWYAVVGLLLAVAVLPLLKQAMPQYFPVEGFRDDISCREAGITCPEGNFCANRQCIPISTRYPNAVPTGDL